MNESTFRSKFTYKLRKLGWTVHEEKTLLKNGKKYRADILAYHQCYKELGWFVIEAKTAESMSVVTKGHKQIVTKYIGSTIQFNNEKPICFAILAPWIPSPRTEGYWDTGWPYVERLFNRYGIGIIDNTQTVINFCCSDPKYEVFLETGRRGLLRYNNLPILKKYLSEYVKEL